MPLFFFISGFLTKEEFISRKVLSKYWHNLLIPYFCYNIIHIPYWVARHISDATHTNWYDIYKPLLGTLFMQHESSICEPLNGVTWFIAILFLFKILLSLCNRIRIGKLIILLTILLCSILYIINEKHRIVTSLPTVGLLRCLPFFFLGYYVKRGNWISNETNNLDGFFCVGGFLISIITFLLYREENTLLMFGLKYFTICVFAILGFLCLCKVLDHIHSHIIVNISIGTIVILGFHWMLIGTTNYILTRLLCIEYGIKYQWFTAIFLSITIVAILYPVILVFKKRVPFMLGKSNLRK